MKYFYQTSTILATVFALFVVTLVAPSTVLANASSTETTFSSASSISSILSSSESASLCRISVNSQAIVTGGKVVVSWETAGFRNLTLNGETIYRQVGTRAFENIQANTTFVLEGVGNNNNTCRAVARVTVGECVLQVNKTVDKTTATPGADLTYTIKVKNTGTANCTGGGVKIVDVVDPNLTYLRHTLTNNLTAGYGANPVYNSDNRTLSFNGNTLEPGEEGIITWVGKVNTPTTCGNFVVRNQAKATAKELNNFETWVNSQTVTTNINNACPVTVCDKSNVRAELLEDEADYFLVRFTNNNDCDFAVGATSYRVPVDDGKLCIWQNRKLDCQVRYAFRDITLAPKASQEVRVAKPNKCYQFDWYYGVSVEKLDYSKFGDPVLSYVINAVTGEDRLYGARINATLADCGTPAPEPAPRCDSFVANPTEVEAGKPVTLTWRTTNATALYINNGIGRVDALHGFNGSMQYSPATSTNLVLTARGTSGREVTCSTSIAVRTPVSTFSCANNVVFTASDNSITRGDSTRLEWRVVGADSVSISTINATSLAGNQTVSPSSDTTYTLTAKKGTETINCPLSIDVSSGGGGGGGGTASPKCELEISDTKIKAGESITLKWKTSNATEVILSDDKGKTVMSTEDLLSKDKKAFFDDSIKLKPTRDTKYTLVAERGSRDDECTVQVKIEKGEVVILETRDQQPLVAGIALSQVPYTGFEAGPALTFMFYVLLIAWALYVTYLIVLRKRNLSPENYPQLSTENSAPSAILPALNINANMVAMQQAEMIRPDVFPVQTVVAPRSQTVPNNLPVGNPVIGYDNYDEISSIGINPHQVNDETVTAIENRAHEQKALLSSDAIRHFIATTAGEVERNEALDEVIDQAKKTYPLEDGWIVINEVRMRNLCVTCQQSVASSQVPFVPATIPEGSGSLAEAIVTGNIVAAYEMIGNRPMFALADASADLDSVYRHRKGEKQVISELLISETARLSDEQLREAITALTSAIDGTYTDEASAVKMAIMKAVKAVA